MENPLKPEDVRIGFLATITPADNVFLGGLLVTNRMGRPLEFQCTAPVEPNATQTLLYGPTLKPYVLTELIGKTLVERLSITPHLVLVDSREMLPLRSLIEQAVACVSAEQLGELRIGRQFVQIHDKHAEDRHLVQQVANVVPNDADVAEPFERVAAALKEALSPGANAA